VDGFGEVVGQAEDPREGAGVRGVFVERGQGPVAPGAMVSAAKASPGT
jgi:hypothetical protein